MLNSFKSLVKRALKYQPLAATRKVREFVASLDDDREAYYPPLSRYLKPPYCTPDQGDLLHALVTQNDCTRCLEVGFASGSTAIYILDAMQSSSGTLISIDTPTGVFNDIGQDNIRKSGFAESHHFMAEDSATAIPRLYQDKKQFDLVYMDGWKTFDHLAAEIFYITRMLKKTGFLVFDDSAMPSVDKVIKMLLRYYGYREIDYARHNLTKGNRLYQILTTRTLRRPYRAFQKVKDEAELPVTKDWNFFADF